MKGVCGRHRNLRGTEWKFSDGTTVTLQGDGLMTSSPTVCKTGQHRECVWTVNHGQLVVEWGQRGLFVAQMQQQLQQQQQQQQQQQAQAVDSTDMPSALVGSFVTGAHQLLKAELVGRKGR